MALDVDHYQPSDGSLTIRSGKGGRDRRAFLTGGAQAAVDAWLTIRGSAPGPLLCSVHKNGEITVRRMSPDALYRRLQRLGGHAGIARFSPHDHRPSFVSDLLDAGADLAAVQGLAGHRRPETTVRLRPTARSRPAAGRVHALRPLRTVMSCAAPANFSRSSA